MATEGEQVDSKTEGGETKQPDYSALEKNYKNLQAAFTRASQELKAIKDDAEYRGRARTPARSVDGFANGYGGQPDVLSGRAVGGVAPLAQPTYPGREQPTGTTAGSFYQPVPDLNDEVVSGQDVKKYLELTLGQTLGAVQGEIERLRMEQQRLETERRLERLTHVIPNFDFRLIEEARYAMSAEQRYHYDSLPPDVSARLIWYEHVQPHLTPATTGTSQESGVTEEGTEPPHSAHGRAIGPDMTPEIPESGVVSRENARQWAGAIRAIRKTTT